MAVKSSKMGHALKTFWLEMRVNCKIAFKQLFHYAFNPREGIPIDTGETLQRYAGVISYPLLKPRG